MGLKCPLRFALPLPLHSQNCSFDFVRDSPSRIASLPRPMAVETQGEDAWRSTTEEALTRNESCVQGVKDMLQAHSTDQASWRAKQKRKARAKEAQTTIMCRAAHEEIMDTFCSCVTDTQKWTSTVKVAAANLRSQRKLGFAALQVCDLRQELRGNRPPSENINDGLQKALKAEKQLLEDSHVEMQDLENEGKNIAEELDSMRQHV